MNRRNNNEDIEDYRERRQAALQGRNPYPHQFAIDYRLPEFREAFADRTEGGSRLLSQTVAVAGRIVSIRGQGRLHFYDILGDGVQLQVLSDRA